MATSGKDSPSTIVIFGALGDLAQRKLFAALYSLENAQLLTEGTRIIGVARDEPGKGDFIEETLASVKLRVKEKDMNNEAFERFSARLQHCFCEFDKVDGYQTLKTMLDEVDSQVVYYFATPAALYGMIAEGLYKVGAVDSQCRVVLEKPIGSSLESSTKVNTSVARFFTEAQTYRIDHYLGKETVQNLIALRFANPLFGAQWNRNFVSHVEITVAETVGIEGRWGYFDKAGQIRDMLQNHLLQILCLTAMDPPFDITADSIRDEKVKVLRALRPITPDQNDTFVRGRYSKGILNGEQVPGYMDEEGANPNSKTETFVAIKAEIDNWRWAGVPFYLRTGKRLPEKVSQITIHFRVQPHFIFGGTQGTVAQNRLIIRLEPDEGISLQILNKDQGLDKGMQLRKEQLELNFSKAFHNVRIPDAYERLMLEVIKGNQYLFVRRDEIEHAWRWCDRLFEHPISTEREPHAYAAGTWGPKTADLMILKDGYYWHEDQ